MPTQGSNTFVAECNWTRFVSTINISEKLEIISLRQPDLKNKSVNEICRFPQQSQLIMNATAWTISLNSTGQY